MENSAVVNQTGPLCPVGSALRVPPLGYRMVKRAFDLTAALILSVLLAVPAAILMLLIRLDSPGPAIFRQERLGKNGKPFMILKLRSMRLDAEKNGPRWAERNDSRCTRLGSFLRRSRLDELPQLWNILHGEMSFVGPRPERAYFYDQFEKTIPGFRNRLAVIPGLTDLCAVPDRRFPGRLHFLPESLQSGFLRIAPSDLPRYPERSAARLRGGLGRVFPASVSPGRHRSFPVRVPDPEGKGL